MVGVGYTFEEFTIGRRNKKSSRGKKDLAEGRTARI